MWERSSRFDTLSLRTLALALIASLLLFPLSVSQAAAATTRPLKVGGTFPGSPLAQGGVVWFNGYDPAVIVIRPGDTVQWKLVGGIHTVTSTEPRNATAWVFDSSPLFPVAAALGDLSPGRLLPPLSVYEVDTSSLNQGTYAYFCKIHPGMKGNLTVTGGFPIDRVVNVVAGSGDIHYAVQAFAPENVAVPQGTIVRWTLMNPTEPHTITGTNSTGIVWDSSPNLPPGLPPVMVVPGTTFNVTFNSEGTFTYFCKLHAYRIGETWVGMTGTIIVESAASDLSSAAYAGLGLGVVALVIAALGLSRRRGPGGPSPPSP